MAMAYADFTMEEVHKTLGISVEQEDLFQNLRPVEPSPWLQEALAKGRKLALLSEKARSELLVMPILLTSRELSQDRFAIYSGQRMDVDPALRLVGECDFILTLTPPLPFLETPVMTILEAKKGDIEAGLGQCVAQMRGAWLLNHREGKNIPAVYGCVTTGEDWQFLRLHEVTLAIDSNRYYLDNLRGILGVFQAIVAACQPESRAA
jgi:hypothetical protein